MSSLFRHETSIMKVTVGGSRTFIVDTKSAECLSINESGTGYLRTAELKFQGHEVTAPVLTIDNASNNIAIKNGGISLSDLLKKEMANPIVAARASAVRRRIGQVKQAHGIAKLRLSAGMSQQQVADAMGVQQPAIARWERHPGGISASNMRDMAAALSMTMSDVAQAIDEQLSSKQFTRLEHA